MRKAKITRIVSLHIVSIMASALCFYASATVPPGYYDALNGKSGKALKDQLQKIISPHTQLTYNSLWTFFEKTDVYPTAVSGKQRVWEMYSNNYYYYPSHWGLNREHSFPKSWWGGTENEAYTDINHLYPSDGDANMAKSNYPLGIVSETTFDNGVTKVGPPKAGLGGGASRVFEPADQYKGDFARTYFYMATMYQNLTWKYTWMLSNSNYLTLSKWAYDMLIEWSRNDPVDDKEINRNEAVFGIQNNRNPFIDNPGLEEYIWGSKQGQPYVYDSTITGDPELVTPTQNMEINFGEIGLGKSVTTTVYVKAHNLTSNLSVMLYRDDYTMFKIPVTSISRTTACGTDGYALTITYTPTNVGEHKARLLFSDGGIVGSIGAGLSGTCLPAPTLQAPTATAPQEVSAEQFLATWRLSSEEVDHYEVEHITYVGANRTAQEVIQVESDELRDDAIGSCLIEGCKEGETHTYRVRSYRLGYTSEWSQTISVTTTSVPNIGNDESAFGVLAIDGAIVIRCASTAERVIIVNPGGQIVMSLNDVVDGTIINIPAGIYFVKSTTSQRAVKAIVK